MTVAHFILRNALRYGVKAAIEEWSEDVSSSAFTEVDYDESAEELTITFRDGSVYTYDGVPSDVFDNLRSAGSAGAYFNANIRNAYSFR